MSELKYKVSDTVTAAQEMIEEATGDHPRFELCRKGQKLTVIEVDSKYSEPYLVQDLNKAYSAFSMKEDELT